MRWNIRLDSGSDITVRKDHNHITYKITASDGDQPLMCTALLALMNGNVSILELSAHHSLSPALCLHFAKGQVSRLSHLPQRNAIVLTRNAIEFIQEFLLESIIHGKCSVDHVDIELHPVSDNVDGEGMFVLHVPQPHMKRELDENAMKDFREMS